MNLGIKNKLNNDKLYEDWIKTLGKSTAHVYKYGIIAYCDYTGKSCTGLINEAREDYINRVAPWELRHIREFEGFIQALKTDQILRADEKKLSNWAKIVYINSIRNFYQFNKIPVESLNKINIPAMASEKYLDLDGLKLEDIRKAVLSCGVDDKLMKALILVFLSSGQGQAEIQKLQGRHLKNVVNGVAVVNMTRGKTHIRYTFFIGQEALSAIHGYKPVIGDNDIVFTQKTNDKPLNDSYINMLFRRLSKKLGWNQAYFQPHRFRHYFKSQMSGFMDSTFIEYFLGHKLPGVESNYFLGNQDKMLEQYVKNQDKLTVFTDAETLQKQYDIVKQENNTIEQAYKEMQRLNIEKDATLEKVIKRSEEMNSVFEKLLAVLPEDTLKAIKPIKPEK